MGIGRCAFARTAITLALVVAALTASRTASAEDIEAIVKKGVELRRLGQDREALAEFQRALAIQRLPRIVSQIGLAEQALGDWVNAEAHLGDALAHTDDPWIQKNRAILQQALASVQNHLGIVDVWGDPAGAEVLLNDEVVGKLPLPHPIRVTESQVTLKVRAPGYAEIVRSLRVPLGDLIREHVELRPINVALAPVPPPTSTQGSAPAPSTATSPAPLAVATKAPTPEPQPPKPASSSVLGKWWFWTLVGAAAVGAGTGIFLMTRGGDNSSCTPPGCTTWSN